MRSAEATMVQARVRGQGQTNIARGESQPTRAGTDQLALEEHLRVAIAQDRVGLHYQPIVANDGSVTRAEALLRWVHPEHGPLSRMSRSLWPNVAGCWLSWTAVLRTVLRESAGWQRPDGHPVGSR